MKSLRAHPAVSTDTSRDRRLATHRAAIVLATTALLVACGGDDEASVDIPSPATSEPSTPSSAVSDTSLPSQPTVATTTPAAPAAESTAPQVTEPVGTGETTETGGGYRPADATSTLANGMSDPIVSPLPDGNYWSWNYTADGSTVQFALTQVFVGDACRERFGDAEDACASDNETLNDPTATVTMSGDAPAATVLVSDGAGGYDRFAVSSSEFRRLASGQSPATDAPTGYSFEPISVIVTVRGGEVVAVDQIFVA